MPLQVGTVFTQGDSGIDAAVKAGLTYLGLATTTPYANVTTAEYLALWAKSAGHEPWYYWYVTVCIGLSLVVYAVMPEPQANSRIVEN